MTSRVALTPGDSGAIRSQVSFSEAPLVTGISVCGGGDNTLSVPPTIVPGPGCEKLRTGALRSARSERSGGSSRAAVRCRLAIDVTVA